MEYSDNYSKTIWKVMEILQRWTDWYFSQFRIIQIQDPCWKIEDPSWKIPAAGNTKDVEKAVPLKCLNNFWRTPEMFLVKCKLVSF